MPVFPTTKESRHRAAREGVSPTPETSRPSATSSPTMPFHSLHHSIGDLLEPAIEGPPSPERIRAISNHMKRNSSSDKHRSELTTSSGSSSRLSGTSDRPSWNPSLESLSLSRNPSQRSTSSGVPSRDRPDSVQFFGKGIFNRRGKLRRESSDQSAHSHSSFDAPDMPIDTVSAAFKDQPFIQSVFARRRALRGESVSAPQKKLQISGPYNFQHVTHTPKTSVPDLDRSNRIELVSEFSSIRPRRPTDASVNSVQHDESQFTSFSSDTFFHQEDPSAGLNARNNAAQSREKDLPPPPPPPVPPMRLAGRRNLSQDKIRVPPPRPPRSPTDSGFKSPIPPPPRTSSRGSLRRDGVDSLLMSSIDRPATTTGFRKPQPFSPTSPKALRSAPLTHIPPVTESAEEDTAELGGFPRAVSTPDEAAWPLGNNVKQLPDVPEEDEHHSIHRKSRMSVASNHSSLRGSISVPLLRQLSLKQSPQRPPSNASDTLGIFDFANIQRLPRSGARDDNLSDDMSPINWEDDIDYCYEHEAEADCDYAWERPSIDITREDVNPVQKLGDQTETIVTYGGFSPRVLSPKSADIPALSPASQISNLTQQEAITPRDVAIPVTSNFSLPRRDSSAQLLRDGSRTHSPEMNFKESQGFSLSPSLLIPNDYHQEMLQYEREELQDSEDDEDFLIQGNTLNDEPIMKFGKNLAPSNIRSSASTTDSVYSEASSRHKSTTSNSTAFTRWTGSSTSSWQTTRDSTQHILHKPVIEEGRTSIASPTKVIALPTLDDEAILKQDLKLEKHSRTQSHANLLMRNTSPTADAQPAKEPLRARRRARTTSRSHASPQFALFPSISPTTHGNRI